MVSSNLEQVVSPNIADMEVEASIPRYLVFCAGLSRNDVHAIRNAYKAMASQCASILKTREHNEYEVKIIGFYTVNLKRIFSSLGLTPNLLILGPELQAPYPTFVKDWIKDRRPSVMRFSSSDSDSDPANLPREEFYIGTHSVVSLKNINDSWRVSNEIDYGILVNLNHRREVKIEDYDHHVVSLDDIDSSFEGSMRESSAFPRGSDDDDLSTAAAFFNGTRL